MYDLSIIVPVYNVEKYLKEAINSLLCLDRSKYEIILVDDGSKDSCSKICDNYKHLENFIVIHKDNGGLPSARKAGLEVSSGLYVGFLDGDDWVGEDYYPNMLESVKESNADVVCSSLTFVFKDRICSDVSNIKDGLYEKESLDNIRRRLLYIEPYYTYGIAPSLCTKIFKREWLREYLLNVPNNITLGEDALCSFPIMFNCEKIYVLHSNKDYFYRQNDSSMTKVYDENKYKKVLAAINYFDQVMEEKYTLYKSQIDMFYSSLIKEVLSNEVRSDKRITEIKEKLVRFKNDDIVSRTLNECRQFPFLYKTMFSLYRRGFIYALILCMRMKNRID